MRIFSSSCSVLVLLIFPLAGTTMAGAAIADERADLAASKAKWEEAKKGRQGNYRYFVRTSSFTGAGTETEVVVRGGKVAGRRFQEFGPPEPVPPGEAPPAITYKWTERGAEVGTNKEGAPAKSLDELYLEAEKIVVKELAPHEKRYVAFDDKGLLRNCFIVDTRIQDDAPHVGVILTRLQLE